MKKEDLPKEATTKEWVEWQDENGGIFHVEQQEPIRDNQGTGKVVGVQITRSDIFTTKKDIEEGLKFIEDRLEKSQSELKKQKEKLDSMEAAKPLNNEEIRIKKAMIKIQQQEQAAQVKNKINQLESQIKTDAELIEKRRETLSKAGGAKENELPDDGKKD